MGAFDAYFGRIQSNGTDLEIQGAINFVGMTVAANPAQGRVDVSPIATRAANRMVEFTVTDDFALDWSFTAHDAAIRGYDHLKIDAGAGENSTLTLHTDGAVENDQLSIQVLTDEAYFTIMYDGTAIAPQQLGNLLCTYDFRFDGTDWIFWRFSELPTEAPPT